MKFKLASGTRGILLSGKDVLGEWDNGNQIQEKLKETFIRKAAPNYILFGFSYFDRQINN